MTFRSAVSAAGSLPSPAELESSPSPHPTPANKIVLAKRRAAVTFVVRESSVHAEVIGLFAQR
jgi:hypothetical protein